MNWVVSERPNSDNCPEKFCFHWIPPGGHAAIGQTFGTVKEAFKKGSWTHFPEGGCSCSYGQCRREDQDKSDRDYYEPCDPRLDDAELPEFYFSTLYSIHAGLRPKFVREACKYWGRDQLTEQELELLDQVEEPPSEIDPKS